MKKTWIVFWRFFYPVPVVVTFLVFLFMGIKRRKQITNDRVRYFFWIFFEALRRPLDGFNFLPKGKNKERIIRKVLGFRKILKRVVKVLKRPFVLIEWEDD